MPMENIQRNCLVSYLLIRKIIICDTLRDLVPFVQFKKREKHPRRSVTFSKAVSYRRLCSVR